jgi:hypothetical protein
VYLGTLYRVSVTGTTCWLLGSGVGAPVKGAIADHCGGDAYDEVSRFDN